MGPGIHAGAVLAGKYRVDRVLGEGGMGVVALAQHLQLGVPVAIKYLHPHIAHAPELVQRFLREAQAAVRLRSEHVARVLDVGTFEGGAPYMVMEFLEGTDLDGFLRQHGALPVGQVANFLLMASEALAEAHGIGIVHRDIKPANFFLVNRSDGRPTLKILDFGISKTSMQLDQGLTGTQAVMGTPAYMSPEQMRSSRDVDLRTDIWALGVVMHEALTGTRPFDGESFSELVLKVATEPAPPLPAYVDQAMRVIVARCLEKDRTRRYASVRELIVDLAPLAESRAQAMITLERVVGTAEPLRVSSSQPAQLAATPVAATTLGASAGQHSLTARPTRRRGWIALAAVATLAVAGLAIAVTMSMTSAKPSAPTPDPVPEAARAPSVPGPAAPEASAPDASAPEAVTVRVTIDSIPTGARVFREATGIELGVTPFHEELPPDNGQRAYLLRLAGHVDQRVSVSAATDQQTTVTMAAMVSAGDRTATKRTRGKPPRAATPSTVAPATEKPKVAAEPPPPEKPKSRTSKPVGDGVADPFANE